MKHIFLDTNIVIDVLSERKPFSVSSSKILTLAAENKAIFYLSTISYQIINYVLKKGDSRKNIIALLLELESMTIALDVTGAIIKQALNSSRLFKDRHNVTHFMSVAQTKTQPLT